MCLYVSDRSNADHIASHLIAIKQEPIVQWRLLQPNRLDRLLTEYTANDCAYRRDLNATVVSDFGVQLILRVH